MQYGSHDRGGAYLGPEADEEGQGSDERRVVEIEDDVGPLLGNVELRGGG